MVGALQIQVVHFQSAVIAQPHALRYGIQFGKGFVLQPVAQPCAHVMALVHGADGVHHAERVDCFDLAEGF